MTLFPEPESTEDPNLTYARGVAKFGNQIADQLVALHRQSREMLFHREGWDVAKLQAVVDAMGPAAIQIFQRSAALAAFLNQQYPGKLNEEELRSPVSYDKAIAETEGRIVFDPDAEYPGPKNNDPGPA